MKPHCIFERVQDMHRLTVMNVEKRNGSVQSLENRSSSIEQTLGKVEQESLNLDAGPGYPMPM